jgi:hypothetical protein
MFEPSVTAFTSCVYAYTTYACAVIGHFGRTTILKAEKQTTTSGI